MAATREVLSRDVLKWLQSLDLTYPVKNLRRAFSNGFLVAEVLSHYSNDIQMHAFDNGTALKRKLANWEMLSKFFRKHNIPVSQSQIEGLVHAKRGAAVPFIEFLYTFLTRKPVKKRKRRGAPALAGAEGAPTPDFAKPTASKLIKEALTMTEDELVQDREVRAAINQETIRHHLEEKREHMRMTKTSGRGGAGESISRRGTSSMRGSSGRRRESGGRRSGVVEIKEVSRSKDGRVGRGGGGAADGGDTSRADYDAMDGALLDDNEMAHLELLGDESDGAGLGVTGGHSVVAMMNEEVERALKDTEVYTVFEPRDAPISSFLEHLRTIPANAAGAVFLGILERTTEFTEVFLRESSVPVDEMLGRESGHERGGGGQFAAFSRVMLSALQFSPALSAFEHACHVMCSVGQQLVAVSPAAAWALFEDAVLPKLVARLASVQAARGLLLKVVLSFSDNTPAAHLLVITKMVEYRGVLSKKNALVPCLLVLFRMEPAFDGPLLTTYVQHADAGLTNTVPSVRIAALALLTHVCTSSSVQRSIANGLLASSAVFDYVLPYVEHMAGIAADANWQVQAQLLCLTGFLLERLPSRHPSERGIYALVEDVLAPSSPISVKKIGLATLAPCLRAHPSLGLHYVLVLLSLPHPLRDSLIRAEAVPFVVASHSLCVQDYTLPPPVHTWSPLVIANAIVLLTQERGLDNLEREHMAVLRAAVRTEARSLDSSAVSEWSRVWSVLHEYVFVGLCDDEVCGETVGVLQELFLLVPGLIMDSLTTHRPTLIGCLRMLIRMGSLTSQQMTADWLASLFNQGGSWQQVVGQLMLSSSPSEVGRQGAPLQRLQAMVQQFAQSQ
ncbi:spermatogenesis associated 4 [Thecamonas trahens ATCC 50062]|uniref:Spermatogenesis associated 4 n=1 Tax=Thecamonas trahens ATCC 50062 TaxID=461836 RepID=A0A0L0D8Q7_THETB|nr:spermatogenesis associated 4 [Thecamonas trahens ATCC 50062]KNC48466.1 spermatogenesis associated 4 [Thecamonas trahens ATCC 50062]|eukprot:XP_013758579.1 spermatogenesis associated 4 [Thecamonas trahens ATCC 50062]